MAGVEHSKGNMRFNSHFVRLHFWGSAKVPENLHFRPCVQATREFLLFQHAAVLPHIETRWLKTPRRRMWMLLLSLTKVLSHFIYNWLKHSTITLPFSNWLGLVRGLVRAIVLLLSGRPGQVPDPDLI